jgi:hypothetical protein
MKHHQMMACMILAAALVGYMVYAQGTQMMEPFKGNKGNGKLMFNGSYPSAPVVCLAGNKHIPCTAFSSA